MHIKRFRPAHRATSATRWTGRSTGRRLRRADLRLHARGARHRLRKTPRRSRRSSASGRSSRSQPWGIFFVKFEPKKLPVVALRRILSQRRAQEARVGQQRGARRLGSRRPALRLQLRRGRRAPDQLRPLLRRRRTTNDLPTLKVLGWDNLDTALHLDDVAANLTENLAWPDDEARRARRGASAGAPRSRFGHREVVTTSKELSIRLAELARRYPRSHQDRARDRDRRRARSPS